MRSAGAVLEQRGAKARVGGQKSELLGVSSVRDLKREHVITPWERGASVPGVTPQRS